MSKELWVKIFKPKPAASMRLICLPFAGGSAQVFMDWDKYLPEHIELAAVQYPGRGSRFAEPLITHIDEMVDGVATHLKDYLDKPFVLFGHSMGAAIGFKLTQRLQAEGVKPELFCVSARHAPHVPRPYDGMYDLPDDAFQTRLEKMNGTPKEVLEHPELMELMIPLLRADFQISETGEYDVAQTIQCPLVAFGGVDDPDIPAESVRSWAEVAGDTFNMYLLNGDHFFIADDQCLSQVVQHILGSLE